MHEVLELLDLLGGREIPHDRQIRRRYRRVILGTFRDFGYREKRDVLMHELPMPRNFEVKERIYVVDLKRESDHWISR
jgi:hypothetical protein